MHSLCVCANFGAFFYAFCNIVNIVGNGNIIGNIGIVLSILYELYEYCIKHLHGIASTHSSSLKDLHSFDVFAEPVCGFKDKGGLGID